MSLQHGASLFVVGVTWISGDRGVRVIRVLAASFSFISSFISSLISDVSMVDAASLLNWQRRVIKAQTADQGARQLCNIKSLILLK